MSETTGAKDPIENFEADVFRALDRYFEARLREVARNPKGVGGAVESSKQLMHLAALQYHPTCP